ncbi:MAG: DNA polymerase III subunit alpha [Clostridiales bacterium]|jgi:DNA polymerase-3 subunit alpha|nr:DNA polymerase III subunit alpha [Clostridiales bacterium]
MPDSKSKPKPKTKPAEFAHLHVHTEYSLLDGLSKIGELTERAAALNMKSIAITDHGVMYGVIEFYKAAVSRGIKPVLGCEVYVASGSRLNKEQSEDNYYYHLVLLAENEEGYKNLIKLVSSGFTEGFYYKPRVDRELLRRHGRGLIALSACVAGVVAKDYLMYGYERALESARVYADIFGRDNFFIEIQDHGLEKERESAGPLIKIAGELGLGLVATNDAHYIYQQDAAAHDVLLCVQTGKTVDTPERMRYDTDQMYLKSPKEMAELFARAPEAVANTVKIAERCNVKIEFNSYKLPSFKTPAGREGAEYLAALCEKGLESRFTEITDEIRERLAYEISVIKNMGFVDYFLIVWDFIRYAGERGIAVGPGRGSAAGSLASYCLGITSVDPIRYNLLFERFLNPERVSMPDIDIDFCFERRQEVIDYVISKYGQDKVAQIITFGTMAARAAIRDTARALGMPYSFADRAAKLIPHTLGITIEGALDASPELFDLYKKEDDARRLIDMAKRLEGLPRHASTHAAGVVIVPEPIMEYVPLNVNDGVVTTQFPMGTIEELGLLKMDFLGLRTLSVIRRACEEIKKNHGLEIDFNNCGYDDPAVYALMSSGQTDGVFQLESAGMRSFFRELSPSCLEDVIAGIALFRPGPMDFIPKYLEGKNRGGRVTYTHPALEPILAETYGCIVYQEQVMRIVRSLAGYGLSRSDLVRRAMSKKKTEVMEREREAFVGGCVERGIERASAARIFEEMTDFAKYAFNKSHAAAYAVVGYRTAYLKAHYPVEFMAALFTSVMDAANKITEYSAACKRLGIELAPPDINESEPFFSVSGGKIRYGLSAIKNLGTNFVLAIRAERAEKGAFRTLTEFISRMLERAGETNKRQLESLIMAGAFDCLGKTRASLMLIYPDCAKSAEEGIKKSRTGQLSLFDIGDSSAAYDDPAVSLPEFPKKILLAKEKEVLGAYVSGHLLDDYMPVMNPYINCSAHDFVYSDGGHNVADGQGVVIGGQIVALKEYTTKAGKRMGFLSLEDLYGVVEVVLFAPVYERARERLSVGEVVMVKGSASLKEEEDAKILCDRIGFYDDIARRVAEKPLKTIEMAADK